MQELKEKAQNLKNVSHKYYVKYGTYIQDMAEQVAQ
jgi:hypothetical protein